MRFFVPLLLLLSACLIDQPIEQEEEFVEEGNHAPQILRRHPDSTTLHLQRGCSPKFTTSLLQDGDREDDLEIKWFVNYDDGNTTPVDTWFVDAREASGEFRFVTNRELTVVLRNYDSSSVLVVEAVVSDGFADPAEPPRHRAIADQRGSASAAWTIIVSEESWCNIP